MPLNYTANATAVQSPSAAPGPGVMPILALPVDSDSANAASLYQPLKVLADNVGYLNLINQTFNYTITFTTATPDLASNAGTIIDNTIDWRHRMLWIDAAYLGSATQLPLHTTTNPIAGQPNSSPPTALRLAYFTSGGGFSGGSLPQLAYIASGGIIFQVDTSGNLRICRNSGHAAPIDAANGDLILVHIAASTQY